MATPAQANNAARKEAQLLHLANTVAVALERFGRGVETLGPTDPKLFAALLERLAEMVKNWSAELEECQYGRG